MRVEDRPRVQSRPTSTEPTPASALGINGDQHVFRRPTIPGAPMRISNTALPVEDPPSIYVDEQSTDDVQTVPLRSSARVSRGCADVRVPHLCVCRICRSIVRRTSRQADLSIGTTFTTTDPT
jgi:hypothetical protein